MDPLTHGLVGVAISAFSGTAVSISNPLTIGAMLGAMSPDLDFVIRIFKDDASYLKNHRGISHSVPFLAGFSIAITIILSQMHFVEFNFFTTFLWTFIGALSHTGLDILNSYGAKLFRKKRKGNILTLYDPVITLVGLSYIINGKNSIFELISGLMIVTVYLILRKVSRRNALSHLNQKLNETYKDVDVHVMPSLKAFYKWDFVAHTLTHDIVGQYNPWLIFIKGNRCITLLKILEVEDQSYFELFKDSTVGGIFTEFSPNLHIKMMRDEANDHMVLRAIDLRYFMKDQFMHHATLVLDNDLKYVSSYLHPYSLNKAILVHQ